MVVTVWLEGGGQRATRPFGLISMWEREGRLNHLDRLNHSPKAGGTSWIIPNTVQSRSYFFTFRVDEAWVKWTSYFLYGLYFHWKVPTSSLFYNMFLFFNMQRFHKISVCLPVYDSFLCYISLTYNVKLLFLRLKWNSAFIFQIHESTKGDGFKMSIMRSITNCYIFCSKN